jgi:uncharacterized glyoxalase superfamily protein PhnB
MHNRYDKLKLDYAKSALELKDLYDNTRNDKTEDSALWYMGEALGALCVYYVSCTNTSPSSENTALNNMGPRYNYEPSNECKSWDNLNFFTTTITILALQLSIEEWIIQEIGSSNKANPHFIDHYQLVLNMINSGEEKKNAKVFFEALTLLRNKSSHRHSNATINEKEENKIMHIALPISTTTKLIANDVPEVMGRVNENENRSKILVNTESKEEADRLFHGLSVGGEVEGSMGDSPWGSYAGMFRDKYGIEWIIEFSLDK